MLAGCHAHRVAAVAYRIWEQEGRPEGRAEAHWLLAERLLEVEFRIGFPDATHSTSPDRYLSWPEA